MTFIKANRKKAEAWKPGGGQTPPRLTVVEDMVLSQTGGWAVAEGIPGGSSSFQEMTQDTDCYIKGKALHEWQIELLFVSAP